MMCAIDSTYTKGQYDIWQDHIDDLLPLLRRLGGQAFYERSNDKIGGTGLQVADGTKTNLEWW